MEMRWIKFENGWKQEKPGEKVVQLNKGYANMSSVAWAYNLLTFVKMASITRSIALPYVTLSGHSIYSQHSSWIQPSYGSLVLLRPSRLIFFNLLRSLMSSQKFSFGRWRCIVFLHIFFSLVISFRPFMLFAGMFTSSQGSSSSHWAGSPIRYSPPFHVKTTIDDHRFRSETSPFAVYKSHGASLVVPYGPASCDSAVDAWHKR